MGADNGLVLFQGNKFIQYRNTPNDSNSILDGRVYSMAEDCYGRIWAATYTNGITVIDPKRNNCSKLTPTEMPDVLADRFVNTISPIAGNKMLVNTSKGSYCFHVGDFHYEELLPEKYKNCNVLLHRYFNQRNYYLIQNIGLLAIDKNGRDKLYTLPANEMNFMGLNIVKKELYISGYNGVYKFCNDRLQQLNIFLQNMNITHAEINDVLEDKYNQMWVNSIKYGCLKATEIAGVCRVAIDNEWYKEGNIIYSNFYDKESDAFFVGTQQGLFILRQQQNYFKDIVQSGQQVGTVRCMIVDNNRLLAGTDGGCFALKDSFNILKGDEQLKKKLVVSLYKTKFGIWGSGQFFFTLNRNLNFNHVCNAFISEAENATFSVPVNDSIIFILPGSSQHVLLYNVKTKSVREKKFDLSTYFVHPLAVTNEGVLVNSFNGIYLFDNKVDTFRKVTPTDVAEVSDFKLYGSQLFYATKTNGITMLDSEYRKIRKIDFSKLASTNDVRSFVVVDSVIWFSTENGIGYYKLSDSTQAYFRSGELFNTVDFFTASATVHADTVYFGGNNGIVAVNTKAILKQKESPSCYLIDISVYDRGNLTKVVDPYTRKFKYYENNLEMRLVREYSKLSVFKHYQYKLNDNSEVPVDESGIVKLYNLTPDRYQLNVFEIESGRMVCQYSFTIAPPWYQTWWFRTLMGVLILANGIWISRLYFKRKLIAQQKEIEKQMALQSERDRISSDMHDDLGSGLSSIKLISEMLKKKHSDKETKEDLNEIVDHATELTATMRELVWSLNPRNDDLARFVDHTVQYARQFFEPSDIVFNIQTAESFPERPMNGFLRRNLFLALKEIFNNIIKHAGATRVDCTIRFHEQKLWLQIQDNGIGIAENFREGNGLISIQNRIHACKGIIHWQNTSPGLLTQISVSV